MYIIIDWNVWYFIEGLFSAYISPPPAGIWWPLHIYHPQEESVHDSSVPANQRNQVKYLFPNVENSDHIQTFHSSVIVFNRKSDHSHPDAFMFRCTHISHVEVLLQLKVFLPFTAAFWIQSVQSVIWKIICKIIF